MEAFFSYILSPQVYFKLLDKLKYIFMVMLFSLSSIRIVYGAQLHKVLVFSDGGLDDIAALTMILKDPQIKVVGVVAEPNGITQPPEKALKNLVATAILSENYNYPIFGYHLKSNSSDIMPEQAHIYDGLERELDSKILKKMYEHCDPDRTLQRIFTLNENLEILELGPASVEYSFFRKHPCLFKKVKSIVISGGAFQVPGNVSPYNKAEWNIYQDPRAIQFILKKHIPTTFIPLDISKKLVLYALPNKEYTEFGKIFIKNWQLQKNKYPDSAVFDLAAATYIINPRLFSCAKAEVKVNAKNGMYYAQTYTTLSDGRTNSKVCLGMQVNQVLMLYINNL